MEENVPENIILFRSFVEEVLLLVLHGPTWGPLAEVLGDPSKFDIAPGPC